MIQVEHGEKYFGKQQVLSGVNMQFDDGQIHGIIGRNGSGKTVLFKCIIGFLNLDAGEIKVNGKTIGKELDVIENTGIIIENPGFLSDCTGFKNLKYLAMLKQCISDERIREAIEIE